MRTFIVNYNWPLEYKGTYQVTVEDGPTASIDAGNKVHKYLVEKFGEVKDSSSTVVEVYGTIHKIGHTKDEEWSEEDKLHLNNAILAAEKEWGSDSCTSRWLKQVLGTK